MNPGWRETFWKIVQKEMDHFVQEQADNEYEPDEYEDFDDTILERLGEKTEDSPDRRDNRIYFRYLKRADILTDIRAVEYLRLYDKDRAKSYRVSKGFRKAYNICPRDLGKDIAKAPRKVVDTLNKRADLIFTKMDKMQVDSFRRIDTDTEFILETWLKGGEYDENVVKSAEAQVGVFYEALNFSYGGPGGTIVVNDEDDTSFEEDDSVKEEQQNSRGQVLN